MKRSPGVTFSAVTALIGSILTFLVGLVMVAVMIFAPLPATGQTPMSPAFMRGMFVALSLFYLVPAVWGIATGIGLLRLRNWARISIIVFSVLLVLTGFFAGLVSLLMPTPAGAAGATAAMTLGVKIGMAVFWLTLLGIGVWWLIFFTRSTVKVQFVPAQMDRRAFRRLRWCRVHCQHPHYSPLLRVRSAHSASPLLPGFC
ncbi:MAG TPA: hypothetical protein VLL05_10650 [Terriglobales bacterium]|nr:hypothetical protein [Terriglobales bacterium]